MPPEVTEAFVPMLDRWFGTLTQPGRAATDAEFAHVAGSAARRELKVKIARIHQLFEKLRGYLSHAADDPDDVTRLHSAYPLPVKPNFADDRVAAQVIFADIGTHIAEVENILGGVKSSGVWQLHRPVSW